MAMSREMKCDRCRGTEYPLDPSGICWGCLIDDLRVALSASRAEVERLSRMEAAARAAEAEAWAAWAAWAAEHQVDISEIVRRAIREEVEP